MAYTGTVLNLFLILFIFLQGSLADLAISDGKSSSDPRGSPMWKQLFRTYRAWFGQYRYNDKLYMCNIYIHSVQLNPGGTIIATLEDENYAVLDLEGESLDGHIISFKSTTIYNATEIFPMTSPVKFQGRIHSYHNMKIYYYDANFTSPSDRRLSSLHVLAKVSSATKSSYQSNYSVNIGLAIGIPVTLAIILTATGIGLVVWAVKKGYIRHVASNYNRFDRPNSSTDVQFQNGSGGGSGGGSGSGGTLHF